MVNLGPNAKALAQRVAPGICLESVPTIRVVKSMS